MTEPSSLSALDLVAPDLLGDPRPFHGVHPDAGDDVVLALGAPGLVGQGGPDVDALGQHGPARRAPRATASSIRSTRNVRTASRSRSQATRYQCPKRNHSPAGATRRGRLAVRERGHGLGAHRFEEVDEGARRLQRGDGTDLAQTGGAQLQKRIPPTRIVEVHAGDGKVEGDLLIGLEVPGQAGRTRRGRSGTRTVPAPGKRTRPDRDALVAQEPLVAFEGLPARRMLLGIAGHLQGDRVERERLIGVEQDQDEIRHAFESVESCRASHRGEPTAAAVAMTALDHPFDWHLDIFWTLAIPALVVAYVVATRQRGAAGPPGVSAASSSSACWPCWWRSCGRWATWRPTGPSWPWSSSGSSSRWPSRPCWSPAHRDRSSSASPARPPSTPSCASSSNPMPAVAIVTVVAVGTLTTGVVSLAAHSDVARVVIQIVVLLSGFVLWAPVLTELPGRQPLSAVGRGGYLIVQSIVPSFLSVVWIFAHRPLYSSYDHHGRVLGMSPVLDQQLAGFLAKLSTIAVLWTVAFTLMTRSHVTAGHRGGRRTAHLVRRRARDRAGRPARPAGPPTPRGDAT